MVPLSTRRILCFGDSNTFGCDPHGPFGCHYPDDVRWTGRLNALPRWEICNQGENGRQIPAYPHELELAERLFSRDAALDGAVVMLGTNDLLHNPEFTPRDVTARMEHFLSRMLALPLFREGDARMLLVAPVPMVYGTWVEGPRLPELSGQLAEQYAALADRLGIAVADAGAWGVSLDFDGVHITPEGHGVFAAGMDKALTRIWDPVP